MAAFVKGELLPKRINEQESDKIEILAVEITINKRKWIILNVYRRPESNVENLMEETRRILNKTFSKYDRITLMGDINIKSNQTEHTKTASKLLKELCTTYDLHNLVTGSTCFTHTHESAIDVILTNCKIKLYVLEVFRNRSERLPQNGLHFYAKYLQLSRTR